MNELGALNCKNCAANLDIATAVNGVIKCGYCRSKFTLPKKEASPLSLSFLRQGEHDLDTCKFEEAYAAYEKAAQYDSEEPEAFWGMALAEFKVQYIKDIVNNRLQPICHQFTDKKFTANKNYLSALKYATDEQKTEYKHKAEEIDYINGEFLKLKQSGVDYDCFLCVKVSDTGNGNSETNRKNWTEDAYDADAIYDLLKRNGYTPFFSEREIRGRTGLDYEAMILYALYTSETMLIICRDEEYLRTPWVKNEYTRFKELVNNEEKENDSLTIVYNGTPIDKLPGKNNGKIQGIDYSRREADFEIIKFVENHTPLAKAKREEEKRKNEELKLKNQLEAEELRRQQEQLKQDLANLKSSSSAAEVEELKKDLANLKSRSTSANVTVGSLLERGYQELSFKDFNEAKKCFDKVLNAEPKNFEAWRGLFLIDMGVKDETEIKIDDASMDLINESVNFKKVIKLCNGQTPFQEFVADLKAYVHQRITVLEKKLDPDFDELDRLENKLKELHMQQPAATEKPEFDFRIALALFLGPIGLIILIGGIVYYAVKNKKYKKYSSIKYSIEYYERLKEELEKKISPDCDVYNTLNSLKELF